MLDVTVDQPRRLPVWRVGYKPDRGCGLIGGGASDGRFPGRWDDRDGNYRTIYVGSTLLACLLEILADFRPDPRLAGDLADIDTDEEDHELFPTVPAGRMDPAWLDPRVAGTAELAGDFCWVTTAQSSPLSIRISWPPRLCAGLKDFDARAQGQSTPRSDPVSGDLPVRDH